ncbi:hypothetical protein CDAR_85031 [Caerostris darwini]|uniref:Uncharacterized protein n=1 Tax=Caerostris darwini TaxID=1538125 RepID=A0AAV4N2C7_9ARAC|nr:hypothetical protein CDAR_85031 [Caerostris darwini]
MLIFSSHHTDSLGQKKIAGYRQTATKNCTNKTSPSIGRGAHLIHYLKDQLFPNPSHSVVLPRYKITTPTATIGQKPEERFLSLNGIYVARNWWRWFAIETRAYRCRVTNDLTCWRDVEKMNYQALLIMKEGSQNNRLGCCAHPLENPS